MNSVENQQIKLINLAKKYIKVLRQDGVDTAMSPFCYMAAQQKSPGREKLINLMANKNFSLKYLLITLFNLVAVGTQGNYKTLNENESLSHGRSYKKIVLSWAIKKDINSRGVFQDRKLGLKSSSNYDILWFLIYQDKKLPKVLDKNVIIFFKERKLIKFNLFYFIKVFLSRFFECKLSIKKFLHLFSYQSNFAKMISEKINTICDLYEIQNIVTPYESQPFQNKVFKDAKERNIKTIGYTAVSQPFPSHNIYRDGSPDLLLVHSYQEKKHLVQYLGWPEKKIRLINSISYKNKPNQILKKKIFVPYSINSQNILLGNFEKLVSKRENSSICFFKTQNHPYMHDSNKHKIFMEKLEILKRKYKNFSKIKNGNTSIFFCESYGILELLSRGMEVYQICSNPILEAYNKKIWPGIQVTSLDKHILKYKLKKNLSCIKFGNKKNNIIKYLNKS